MPLRPISAVRRAASALLVGVLLLAAPVSAHAAPSDETSAAIAAKKAQKQQAEAELQQMKTDLAQSMSDYLTLGRRIQQTQAEVSLATSKTVELSAALTQARATLADQAVRLYKNDPGALLELLLTSKSSEDFMLRAEYLVMISEQSVAAIDNVRLLHSESLYNKQSLQNKLLSLKQMQIEADARQKQITAAIPAQQAKAKSLGEDIAELMRQQAAVPSSTPVVGFNPDTVISDANFNGGNQMSAAQIQAFLEQQPGTLATYRAPSHDSGPVKSTAEMVAEAAVTWNVNPKVVLVTLQKEQSLLSNKSPSQTAYDWAMGCGKADSYTAYQYKGFGNQIYWGAQKLRKNADLWSPGATQDIDGSIVHPTNPGTHAQWRYTPHMQGVTSFWLLYWRYFGDPLG